ncbi:FtsW/RodA/SpoVE family cell cycle protein [Sporosarcina oncorhynchi]|uniref:FtsW/RodA/SpoVE family cell cycle protein n=1 Tax=Sporosarcina oncorhynchi TaxID=3056444 RepID=A0ABZ0L694_9BACL|nr:FtsW/RodA/SpoVE family cell cycle protein [Sporosarcina sp. T2O-4]WOV87101.1 FtsW/RodA/SpoVE family cell cycle protein [Sporosarcina sp. T2O-4]
MNSIKRPADRFDWVLAFILLLFGVISIIAISSAQTTGQYTRNFIPSQIQWYVVGSIIIAITMYLEPEQYKKAAWVIYGGGIFLLFLLFILPDGMALVAPRNGAKSWFHLPFGIGSIQPAEFMKTFFIIGLARAITKHHEKYLEKTLQTDFLLLGKILAVLLLPLAFIMMQPDLGTGLVFIAITAALIIVADITWRIILPIFIGTATIGALLLWMALYAQEFLAKFGFKPYHFERIYSWIDPYSYSTNEGLNLITSLNAIGSGEIFGKGYQGREVYVPESHTDFIFSTIGEDWGFVGASLVICLYFFLIYHMTKITLELKDPFSTYICAGIIAMITFHVFENIGMTIQLLPITGIPLPFISYGGSSLMGNMLAIGLIFSMKFHHRTYMFSKDEDD